MSDTRIGTTGLHDGIDELEYHADQQTISQSGIKKLLDAPALYRHELDNPPEPKRHFELGSSAHGVVLGVGQPMVAVHTYDAKTGADKGEATDWRSPSTRVHADKIRADGGIPLLRKDIAKVEAMAEVLSQHKFAMDILSEGRPEVTGYAPHEETGLVRRIRVDWLHPQILGDYKTTATSSVDPKVFARKAYDLGYYIQAPYYLDVCRELGHPAKVFAFIIQSVDPPYLVSVIQLGSASIKRGRKDYIEGLRRLRDCRESGLWPAYVDDNTYAKVDIPDWAFYRKGEA